MHDFDLNGLLFQVHEVREAPLSQVHQDLNWGIFWVICEVQKILVAAILAHVPNLRLQKNFDLYC